MRSPRARAAVSGGVTTMLTYFRTGQYYLNRGGPYAEFFPEVLRLSDGRYHCDYAYHLAPIARGHVDEMEQLARATACRRSRSSCSTAATGCTVRRTGRAAALPAGRSDETYDLAHFEFILRRPADPAAHPALAPVREREPALRGGRHPERLHAARGQDPLAERAARLQRGPAAALRGPRGVDRRVPGQRGRTAST
jgi:allantoinase